MALEVIRHHRLLELHLAETLGIDVDEVHDEAYWLEHALSEELESRIDETLGYPTHDPHGDPISEQGFGVAAGQRAGDRAESDTCLHGNESVRPQSGRLRDPPLAAGGDQAANK